jgi:glycosyltransferase involved in cell wall biosynthesis
VQFSRKFAQVVAKQPYTVVHSHVHHFSGYILWQAAKAGIKTRIAHSFTAPVISRLSPQRWAYLNTMNWLIKRYATMGLGNSQESLQALFGTCWQNDPRWQLMYLGIDLKPFTRATDSTLIRQQYGLPDEALVIGHVGRLTYAKNHRFLIDIAAEIESQCDNIWFVIVGDGPLRTELTDYAQQRGVRHLVMTGGVPETRPWYGVMDLFVFPSLWEGLPQAVVEAQAAGVRCLCANTITPEVRVLPEAVHFMPLADGPATWATACLDWLHRPKLDPQQVLAKFSASPFNIERSVANLSRIYSTARPSS